MLKTAVAVLRAATQDLHQCWRDLAYADIVWKAMAFLLLTPGTYLLMRWLVLRHSGSVVADAEIALALLTTAPGLLGLI